MKKTASILVAMTMLLSGAVNVSAATKPSKVIINDFTQLTDNGFVVGWKIDKSVKKYHVQLITPEKKWVKYKLVKKTKKNKRTFTKKNRYKVKVAGKKYQVYKYDNIRKNYYIDTKMPDSNFKRFFDLKKNKTYKVRVRAINGKLKGPFSQVKTIKLLPLFRVKPAEMHLNISEEAKIYVQVPTANAVIKVEDYDSSIAKSTYNAKVNGCVTKGINRVILVRAIKEGHATIKIHLGEKTKYAHIYVKDPNAPEETPEGN